MSYSRDTRLVARRGYSSVDGIWDDIKSGVKGAVTSAVSFYGEGQRATGAAAALEAQNREMAQALASRSSPGIGGVSTGTALAIGAGVLGLVLILRKK